MRIREPEIPSAMDDWDKEFWIRTGVLVPGSTLFGQVMSRPDITPPLGTPIRIPYAYSY